tara:strand:+ start:32197 stop:33312 length:1116 start_codon:yes stop_codon:yes gene_type:complete
MTCTDFLVDRRDLSVVSCQQRDEAELEPGQALLHVSRFAFTANNITYAALGETLRYWEFFPAPEGKGIIPVWGFADVQASRCDGVVVGQRYYGYYPMATHAVVQPVKVNSAGFVDGASHRQDLAVIYNYHAACATDPSYQQGQEAQQMLFRPLFTTAFLLDDMFADEAFYGAQTLYLTSASSKTALGTAYLLHSNRDARNHHYQIVGLTSAGNKTFVEGLGCYDRVVTYAEISGLQPDESSAIVDFAGDFALLQQLHEQLSPGLKYSCMVGASHWTAQTGSALDAGADALPGPAPQFFFAPSQADKRVSEWGADVFQGRLAGAWTGFIAFVDSWLSIEVHLGERETERVYQNVLAGRSDPRAGYILSLSED